MQAWRDVRFDQNTAIILYAHGARDARWAEPFERLRERVAARVPGCLVVLAFLEHRVPDLATVFSEVSGQGVRNVRVVPLFFGRGGHLRDDFPKQLEEARAAAPELAVELTQAAGEDANVLDALATFALEAPVTPK
jgi:sirohydrochlorin cobaltochelatase